MRERERERERERGEERERDLGDALRVFVGAQLAFEHKPAGASTSDQIAFFMSSICTDVIQNPRACGSNQGI